MTALFFYIEEIRFTNSYINSEFLIPNPYRMSIASPKEKNLYFFSTATL